MEGNTCAAPSLGAASTSLIRARGKKGQDLAACRIHIGRSAARNAATASNPNLIHKPQILSAGGSRWENVTSQRPARQGILKPRRQIGVRMFSIWV